MNATTATKYVKIKVTAKEVTTKDGKKFTAYKGQKGVKLIDLSFTREVDTKQIPKLTDCPCHIVVPLTAQNIQTNNRVYPKWWVSNVIKFEPIGVPTREYTAEDLEDLNISDDLPF